MPMIKSYSPLSYSRKGLKVGLWMVWLCGFLLIGLSFYATTRILPSSFQDQIRKSKQFEGTTPTITIFTAPNPFTGSVGARQTLAVRSWLGLSPNINVVLFSQHPSVFSFAAAFASLVSVEPNIDFSFLGTPFFNSMLARSRASMSDISVLIDPETILLPDFISSLNYAFKLDHDWVLLASPRNVTYYPFHLDADGKNWLVKEGKKVQIRKLQAFLADTWRWDHCEERMLLAWNNCDLPLHRGVVPPFLYGKGVHNHWLINEALTSDFRFVFDATLTITSFYLNGLDSGSDHESWENVGNSLVGASYGSLYFHEANYSNVVKLFQCDGQYLFVNTAESTVYRLEQVILQSRQYKKALDCFDVFKSLDGTKACTAKDRLKLSTPLSLPFSLEVLLSTRADQNKTIILAVAGYSYRDMLMSWVCRLRHLHISNFVVCALDHEMHDFCVLQGVPVFKDSVAPRNVSFDDCHFGTKCFQRVTKVKSRVVLQILKLGYGVLLSDVDVYWFKNPLPLLTTFGPAVLVAQSDEYNVTGPINLPRRLNSGFYYAHSDSSTIAGLEKVVRHAAASNLSEQPSFYDTLCGVGGSLRVADNKCLEPEANLTVHFLDRNHFPNGAYQGLWEERDVKAACYKRDCFVLHNNWINGRRGKLKRQVLSGLWEYDISTRMCLQSWQKTKVPSSMLAMLKRFAHMLGLDRRVEKESRRKNELKDAYTSINMSTQLKDTTVRIVHAGGREEFYQNPVSVSELMKKYPGMCVARPDVFKDPHDCVLSPEAKLLAGQKYLIIPCTTVRKLKRKHSKPKESAEEKGAMLSSKSILDVSEDFSEESACSAKDFYVSKESWSKALVKKRRRGNKQFVPPIQRPKMWVALEWEPSLRSVQEVSP